MIPAKKSDIVNKKTLKRSKRVSITFRKIKESYKI